MAAKVPKADVINTLEKRFDYQSARNVFSNWRKSAGFKDDPAELDGSNLSGLADFIEGLGDNTASLAGSLRAAAAKGGGVKEVAVAVAVPSSNEPEPEEQDDPKEDRKDDKKKRKK
ncbi:MAG: hypothetical protein AUK47_00550 [Deltaproteobacteria bacterium CG2_30_63_29]|nr:MAG: hypothetical protein AUK47_00550 [Deltaproteobacteria bacterium CG2_30_63_29]PJB41801.1 MAG: hypothetical protein CO108_12615 [Deltaproteobacteria bacterium CG_4_9_14_3_um_filter_63_12]